MAWQGCPDTSPCAITRVNHCSTFHSIRLSGILSVVVTCLDIFKRYSVAIPDQLSKWLSIICRCHSRLVSSVYVYSILTGFVPDCAKYWFTNSFNLDILLCHIYREKFDSDLVIYISRVKQSSAQGVIIPTKRKLILCLVVRVKIQNLKSRRIWNINSVR